MSEFSLYFVDHRYADSSRQELYKDVKLNETLCQRYQSHMRTYSRDVLQTHEKVMTASSDIGQSIVPRIDRVR